MVAGVIRSFLSSRATGREPGEALPRLCNSPTAGLGPLPLPGCSSGIRQGFPQSFLPGFPQSFLLGFPQSFFLGCRYGHFLSFPHSFFPGTYPTPGLAHTRIPWGRLGRPVVPAASVPARGTGRLGQGGLWVPASGLNYSASRPNCFRGCSSGIPPVLVGIRRRAHCRPKQDGRLFSTSTGDAGSDVCSLFLAQNQEVQVPPARSTPQPSISDRRRCPMVGFTPAHRSTSPSTKSSEPMMAMMSGTSVPSSTQGRMDMLENDAERILSR